MPRDELAEVKSRTREQVNRFNSFNSSRWIRINCDIIFYGERLYLRCVHSKIFNIMQLSWVQLLFTALSRWFFPQGWSHRALSPLYMLKAEHRDSRWETARKHRQQPSESHDGRKIVCWGLGEECRAKLNLLHQISLRLRERWIYIYKKRKIKVKCVY